MHGLDQAITVTLPEHEGVTGYELLWDSAVGTVVGDPAPHGPGSELTVTGASMQLFRAL